MAISNQVEPALKLSAVREYLAGTGSLNKIAAKYSVNRSTLQKWLLNYEMFEKPDRSIALKSGTIQKQ